jgi:hypothetical protein
MSGSINSELKTEQIEVCAHLPKKKEVCAEDIQLNHHASCRKNQKMITDL